MSLTLLATPVGHRPEPLTRLVEDDSRIDRVVECSDIDALLVEAESTTAWCALVGVSDHTGLTSVDRIVEQHADATIIVTVPAGRHDLGLSSLRHGAQDYVEAGSEPVPEARALLRAVNAAIERSNRVIRRLREHRRMAKVLEHAGEGYLLFAPSGAVLASSPSIARIWPDGFDHLDTIFDTLHVDDREFARRLGVQALEQPGTPAIGEVRAVTRSGEMHWFEIRINDQSADPAIGGLITNVRDITDRVLSDCERERAEARFRLGFEQAAVGMAMSDLDGTISQANTALCDLLGRPAREIIHQEIDSFLAPGARSLRPCVARLLEGEQSSCEVETQFTRGDGAPAWTVVTTVLVPADGSRDAYLFSQFQDVTDRTLSEHALEHQALHDSLTGLPNRVLLQTRLDAALGDDQPPTVLFVDIDNFKVVNDGLGHTTGDRMLVELAACLAANTRDDDTVARFGGDEFAVVLRGLPGRDAAIARAQHLLDVLSRPVTVDGETHFVSVSIGVAAGGPNASAETVLRDADAALHQAKALGRHRVEWFHHDFHSRAEHRLRTNSRMRQALENGHFHVAYQPFLTVADERVIGMEALLRWVDPERGAINPAEFIAVAEQTGLIVQLGSWALDQALGQLKVWRQERPWGNDLSLSVNLSARQLTVDGLVDTVQQSIIASGVDAGALCLEITETAVMSDIEASIGLMRMMRGLGVDLSIDDFGTGYSSLNYLKSLPLTTLKVDRSFIDGLGQDPHDTSIVEAIVALGRALGMRVHAEGVERRDQLDELRRIGCDDAQGWLWAPAMTATDFEEWMESRPN